MSPEVQWAAAAVKNFLGKDFEIKRADAEGFVALSRDGTRRFRMDFEGHGYSPHGHTEVLNQKGRWVDAGSEHHHYFAGGGE